MIKIITTPNLHLGMPNPDDLFAINSFELRNRDHLKKWESVSTLTSENDLLHNKTNQITLDAWIKECEEGKSVRFCIKPRDNQDVIIGFCNFTQIFLGSFQACYLGYKIDFEYEGKGLMYEALQKAIQFIFEDIKLHRIMANYMPINARSAKLLDRLGFTIEGYAKNYLFINNKWEDHVLTSLSLEEWQSNQKNKLR